MMENLKFEPINENDLAELCIIHKSTFSKDHFSSNFSDDLLKKYFGKLLSSNNKYSFKCSFNDKIIGYLVGGNSIGKSMDGFLDENKREVMMAVLKNPSFIVEKSIEIIKKILGFAEYSSISYRLYIIAISPDFRNKGVGKRIIYNFEQMLSDNGIFEYGLSVRKNNTKAIRLYVQTGYSEEFRNSKAIYFRKIIRERN